ncbi:hypothetical protein AMTRI_Chr03g54740 [Amborella trichopoda]
MFKNLDWWFDSHLWVTDGGKIEAKYISRAAELFRQLFSKEANQTVNGLSHVNFTGTSKENEVADKLEAPKVTTSPKAPSHPFTGTIRTAHWCKKGNSSTNASATRSFGSLFPSRFEYVESMQSAEAKSGGTQLLNHVSPLKSSSFFTDFGMDSGIKKKPSSTCIKVQSSTSISSADLFGHNMDDPILDFTTSLAKLISIDTLLVKKLEYLRKLMKHSSHGTIFYFFSLFFDSFAEHKREHYFLELLLACFYVLLPCIF